jgi:VWFA-related protein
MATQGAPPAKSLVQIYLIASGNGDSPPIPTLSQLVVSIDKQPAQVTSLRSANEDKLLFALLVDISGSNSRKDASIREAALQLFQGLLEGGNEGHLVVFNDQIAMTKGTVHLPEVQRKLDSVRFQGGTRLYDAIADTCTKILSRSGNPETPRRAVFLITDGEDDASEINHSKAEEIAEGEGVAIFSLQAGVDGPMTRAETLHSVRFLQEASHNTGGQAIRAEKLSDGVPLLLNAIHEQWALDILPHQARDQELHSLSIKSSEKNVRLSSPAKIPLQ